MCPENPQDASVPLAMSPYLEAPDGGGGGSRDPYCILRHMRADRLCRGGRHRSLPRVFGLPFGQGGWGRI
jgi:hypothetical protein